MSPREYIALFKANVGRNSEAGWEVCIPYHGESDASTDYESIEDSVRDTDKGSLEVVIIKHGGNYFRISQVREVGALTGGYDYYHEVEIEQVKDQEKVVFEWVAVDEPALCG